MQKKFIITALLTCLFPLLNAQDTFSGNIKKFEHKDNGNITEYVRQFYARSCGANPSGAQCINALNNDGSAFNAYYSSEEELALFLLQNNFSLKAAGRVGESAVYLLAQIIVSYNPEETRAAVYGIFNKIANFSPEDLNRLITGQDEQSAYNAVHIAVLYMPKNKKVKDMPSALKTENRNTSIQSVLLDKLSSSDKTRQYLCEALIEQDGIWETPFHTAVRNDNKEAFLTLAEASKNARCDNRKILAAIAQPDKTGLSVTDYAIDKASKSKGNGTKDTFYFNVITDYISNFSDEYKKQADNLTRGLQNAKDANGTTAQAAVARAADGAGISRAILD